MIKVILISFALALDAFAVSIGFGCANQLLSKHKVYIIFNFGFFQALFLLLGALFGRMINNYLFDLGDGISGLIIIIIGLLFIREAYLDKEDSKNVEISTLFHIILAISVSIDALGVGFSIFHNYDNSLILGYSLVVGIITALVTAVSFYVCSYIRDFTIIEKYSEYTAGLILLSFGIYMML